MTDRAQYTDRQRTDVWLSPSHWPLEDWCPTDRCHRNDAVYPNHWCLVENTHVTSIVILFLLSSILQLWSIFHLLHLQTHSSSYYKFTVCNSRWANKLTWRKPSFKYTKNKLWTVCMDVCYSLTHWDTARWNLWVEANESILSHMTTHPPPCNTHDSFWG